MRHFETGRKNLYPHFPPFLKCQTLYMSRGLLYFLSLFLRWFIFVLLFRIFSITFSDFCLLRWEGYSFYCIDLLLIPLWNFYEFFHWFIFFSVYLNSNLYLFKNVYLIYFLLTLLAELSIWSSEMEIRVQEDLREILFPTPMGGKRRKQA